MILSRLLVLAWVVVVFLFMSSILGLVVVFRRNSAFVSWRKCENCCWAHWSSWRCVVVIVL